MKNVSLKALVVTLLVASCGSSQGTRAVIDGTLVGNRVVVEGAGSDELLKLRSGPSLEYNVILGLPDGSQLIRRRCVTEMGQLWCKVALARAPAIEGYVSADYLSTP